MKKTSQKFASLLLLTALSASMVVGCGAKDQPKDAAAPKDSGAATDTKLEKLTVGASPTPHAEILAAAKEELAKKGYELNVVEFTDYVQPNLNLDTKQLDANYFQHLPYLNDFNAAKGTKLVSAGALHYEPFGLYPGKTKTLADLKDGAIIAVPSDTSNEARALLLLEAQGLIKLKADAGFTASKKDIIENPKKLEIREAEAAQLPRALQDVDMAVINGNYALQAGLTVEKNAIAQESKESASTKTYANIVAVREGDETSAKTKALMEALQSDAVKKFMQEKYQGSVVPMF